MRGPSANPEDARVIRPRVAYASSERGIWLFGAGLVIAGALLFNTLEARRTALTEPSVGNPQGENTDTISSPPELNIPVTGADLDSGFQRPQYLPQRLKSPLARTLPTIGRIARAQPAQQQTPPIQPAAPGPVLGTATPFDGRQAAPQIEPSSTGPKLSSDALGDQQDSKERVLATRFKNPGTTVPKGVVIQAVLETALDSTRPGFARAIVSRDIYAFDGSRILIPRGSRLIGEYKADLTLGQKRVLVEWQRLMRPDGVLVSLESPAADPLGRAGIGGRVNNHFLQRFAGSILQSVLQIGNQLASERISRNTYVLALPTAAPGLIGTQGDKIAPTITVRQGSSVSVFVARDLDFTDTDH